MYPNEGSYIAIHPGLIRMTKKLSYSQTGKLGSPYLKWDNFFILTPMRFIQLPGDSPLLYWDNFFILTPMRFIQPPGDSPLLYIYPNQALYIAIHPGLIRMTKKLSYSQTGKLGSPCLKVG
ncbi:hypothetical protein Bca4012_092605 [Brassica carinata]